MQNIEFVNHLIDTIILRITKFDSQDIIEEIPVSDFSSELEIDCIWC